MTAASQEVLDILCEMAKILDTGLDRRTLSVLVDLLEAGIHPEALAAAIQEIRRHKSTTAASSNVTARSERL